MKNLLIHWPLILFMLGWCPAAVSGMLYLIETHVNIFTFVAWFIPFGCLTVLGAIVTFPNERNYLNRGSYE